MRSAFEFSRYGESNEAFLSTRDIVINEEIGVAVTAEAVRGVVAVLSSFGFAKNLSSSNTDGGENERNDLPIDNGVIGTFVGGGGGGAYCREEEKDIGLNEREAKELSSSLKMDFDGIALKSNRFATSIAAGACVALPTSNASPGLRLIYIVLVKITVGKS